MIFVLRSLKARRLSIRNSPVDDKFSFHCFPGDAVDAVVGVVGGSVCPVEC